MDTISQIQGVVNDIISINRDPRNPKVLFKLKTSEGKDYKIDCPFFCPISVGDGFYGVGKIIDVNNIIILKPPFVAIPVDKDNTMQFFLKTLKGTKFGAVSAGKLYDEFEKLAYEFKFGKGFASVAATEEVSKEYNAITPESRYYGDGVIAFLTEYAAEYCNNKNEKVAPTLSITPYSGIQNITPVRYYRYFVFYSYSYRYFCSTSANLVCAPKSSTK